MINKRFATAAFILATAVMLAACGFQLRGSGGKSTLPFSSVYVVVADSSQFGNYLKRYIAAGGTPITSEAKDAEAVIEILAETRNKEILSLNSQGRVREYTLRYTVQFRVIDQQKKILLPATSVALQRILTFNESEVLAKETEEAGLYRDMQMDMVQQVLRRVAAVKPAAVESPPAMTPVPAAVPIPAPASGTGSNAVPAKK